MMQKLTGRLAFFKPRILYVVKIPPYSIRSLSKDHSKLEKTLRLLREDEQKKIEEEEKRIKLIASSSVSPPVKPSIKVRIIQELQHYYHGFRLLALETRLSAKYAWKVLKGATLSRRERQQLVRTVSDLFRLLPFSIFIIVPFMELLLPVFIKLFPNMLPSTFQENNKEEEKIRKQVKMRVEMAKFLQDTIEELALERKAKSKKSTSSQALEFAQFMKKVRNEGGYVSNAEILKYSKLFEDELTLDNLSMGQLRSLCRLMSIQSLGSPEILRFQLNMKLRELKADDKQIAAEGGVDALNTLDLQQACRARGMRAIGLSEERLKDQLRQWLELSLNDNIPPSFLLLSRALYLPEDIAFTDRLKALVQNLPESIAEQTKVKLTEIEGGKVDHKERIDLLKQIENAIAKEKQIEEDENKLKEQQKKADEEKKIDSEKSAPNGGDDVAQTALDVSYDLRKKDEAVDMKLDRLDLSSIGKAITGDLIHEAKHKLNDLKEKAMEQSELLDNKKREGDLTGNKIARRLRSKLNNMIEGMDSLVSKLEEEKKHIEEILADPAVPDEVSKKEQKRVKIQDLINRLASLKNSDEHRKERIEQLLKSLDDDKDGFIDGKLVLEVIDILKQYNNVSISTSQLAELVGTLRKEGEVAISEEKKTKET